MLEIDKGFHGVDHENRLLGQSVGYPDKVASNPHRLSDPLVLLLMRLRYEERVPEALRPQPDTECPAP